VTMPVSSRNAQKKERRGGGKGKKKRGRDGSEVDLRGPDHGPAPCPCGIQSSILVGRAHSSGCRERERKGRRKGREQRLGDAPTNPTWCIPALPYLDSHLISFMRSRDFRRKRRKGGEKGKGERWTRYTDTWASATPRIFFWYPVPGGEGEKEKSAGMASMVYSGQVLIRDLGLGGALGKKKRGGRERRQRERGIRADCVRDHGSQKKKKGKGESGGGTGGPCQPSGARRHIRSIKQAAGGREKGGGKRLLRSLHRCAPGGKEKEEGGREGACGAEVPEIEILTEGGREEGREEGEEGGYPLD